MHDGDEVGLVLLAREEGMTLREAAELAGVPPQHRRRVGRRPPAEELHGRAVGLR